MVTPSVAKLFSLSGCPPLAVESARPIAFAAEFEAMLDIAKEGIDGAFVVAIFEVFAMEFAAAALELTAFAEDSPV